jgi:glucose-6-phosphate 1-dehydrogenase
MIFFIFGVTGDLSRTKLIPALFRLYKENLLPKKFHIVGFGRREWSQEDFLDYLNESQDHKGSQFKAFISHFTYAQGNFDSLEDYKKAGKILKKIDESFGFCANRLFYLAVPPQFYSDIFKNLHASKISDACGGEDGWSRILVEKPFGNDLKTARSLNLLLGKLFKEDQIFRIDHYLAKETVQNILAFRIANNIFDPVWNKNFIEKVELQVFESKVVGSRGAFYDGIGALRDIGQNHLLQMLSLIAMKRPEHFTVHEIRSAREKVMTNLNPFSKQSVVRHSIKGQYKGYLKEKGVQKGSKTETYFKIKTFVNTPEWNGVPFYIESGKGFKNSEVKITVHFKGDKNEKGNVLHFFIQPKEAIELVLKGKKGGEKFEFEEHRLGFTFPKDNRRDAYEKILLDCIAGDHTLFASTKEVEAAWKFIMPILLHWKETKLHVYPQNTDSTNWNLTNNEL